MPQAARATKASDPSFTVSAKWLAFLVALYLCYKEVDAKIAANTAREIVAANLAKDVETIKQAADSLKDKVKDLASLRADFEAERSRNYTTQENQSKQIAKLELLQSPPASKPSTN